MKLQRLTEMPSVRKMNKLKNVYFVFENIDQVWDFLYKYRNILPEGYWKDNTSEVITSYIEWLNKNNDPIIFYWKCDFAEKPLVCGFQNRKEKMKYL